MDGNESQSEQRVEDEMTRQRRIRFEAEKMGESMFSKETRDHLVRASTEIILAIDSMIPRDKIPEDVKQHYLTAKRESLLLVRSLLDSQINLVRDIENKEQPPEAGLRKIELE
jgi:predicted component of type VI protein secretion system